MRYSAKLPLIFSTAMAFLVCSCVSTKKDSAGSSAASGRNLTKPAVTEVRIKKSTEYLDTNIVYPQFEGMTELNALIQNSVMNYYQSFEQSAKNDWQRLGARAPLEYAVTYDYSSDKKYTGVALFTYTFSGGAHGGTFVTTYNYDEVRGAIVSDLPSATGMSYAQLSQKSREALYARLGSSRKEWIEDGASENPGNFEDFIISSDRVTVYFEEYTVAPYSDGIQKVEIKY